MKIDNFDVPVGMQCYAHGFISKVCAVCTFVSTAFAYELLLKTICNIRIAHSAMIFFYIYDALGG